jgi:lactoylglutathione lyase
MTVRFGYTILYVPDVTAAIVFYEAAFGLELRFLHESKLYAEMETGAVTLAFASEDMAEMNGLAIRASRKSDLAAGFELALICVDPQAAWDRALSAGATPVKPPEIKPWGQTVGYVRDLNGCLVELCSDMSSPA